MDCVVTAGPTFEPLDRVRRLTNFSTGQLGCALADSLVGAGHRVTLLRGQSATQASNSKAQALLPFTTTNDLCTQLRTLAGPAVGAVFHAAAVSDFAFGKVFRRTPTGDLEELQAGKFSTHQGPLLAELVPTPKIIDDLRNWFPRAWLVGWKYQVDGTQAEAVKAGVEQLKRCRTDACVVNGPAYGEGYGLLRANDECLHLATQAGLFDALTPEQ